MTKTRPPHRSPRLLGWVVAGGVGGTALRDLLERTFPSAAGAIPWQTFGINVAGALLLGVLLEVLIPRVGRGVTVALSERRQTLRYAVGTGLLGGFTTYSTFVLEALRLGSANLLVATSYVALSLVVGFVAALAGMGAVARARRGRGSPA